MRILFVFFIMVFMSFGIENHPYHVGSVEIKYDMPTQNFEIIGSFFIDDMEKALKKEYGESVKFYDEKSASKVDELLESYTLKYMALKVDDQKLPLHFLGYEEDRESVKLYIESPYKKRPHKIETAVGMLYNFYKDQMNIVHIIVGNKRESDRLRYPKQYLKKEF